MDILRFVRSLEEFLYEAMTWLLFYPTTFWKVVRHPMRLVAEADAELGEGLDQQFTNLVSPPLFLMLSILLAHVVEIALHLKGVKLDSSLARDIFASDENLLIFRSVTFSLYPLLMARGFLRRQGQPIDRVTLRRPFFLQCYLAGPFAVVMSSGFDIMRLPFPSAQVGGLLLCLAAGLWYVAVEAQWLRTGLRIGLARSCYISLKLTFGAFLLSMLVALAIFGPDMAAMLYS